MSTRQNVGENCEKAYFLASVYMALVRDELAPECRSHRAELTSRGGNFHVNSVNHRFLRVHSFELTLRTYVLLRSHDQVLIRQSNYNNRDQPPKREGTGGKNSVPDGISLSRARLLSGTKVQTPKCECTGGKNSVPDGISLSRERWFFGTKIKTPKCECTGGKNSVPDGVCLSQARWFFGTKVQTPKCEGTDGKNSVPNGTGSRCESRLYNRLFFRPRTTFISERIHFGSHVNGPLGFALLKSSHQ